MILIEDSVDWASVDQQPVGDETTTNLLVSAHGVSKNELDPDNQQLHKTQVLSFVDETPSSIMIGNNYSTGPHARNTLIENIEDGEVDDGHN